MAPTLSLPVRLLLVGFPKAGKTGALAPLVNAGFRMPIIDFDGNYEPLIQRVAPEKLANLSIIHLEDTFKVGRGPVENAIPPSAFAKGFNLMDTWKGVDIFGNEVDWGSTKTWGQETIMVTDGLTGLNDVSLNRARFMQNKTLMDTADRTYGLAMAEELEYIKKSTSNYNKFHSIAISHLKMVGPKDIRKGDSDIAKEVKEQISDLIETRYFPNVLGWQMPQNIAGEWPAILRVYKETHGKVTKRYITDISGPELDLAFPAMKALPDKLEITDGMLTVFKALSPAAVAAVMEEKVG